MEFVIFIFFGLAMLYFLKLRAFWLTRMVAGLTMFVLSLIGFLEGITVSHDLLLRPIDTPYIIISDATTGGTISLIFLMCIVFVTLGLILHEVSGK